MWERTGRGGEGREKGEGRPFLSVQSVYITNEESLEYNRAVPWATALRVLSCCQSASLAAQGEGRSGVLSSSRITVKHVSPRWVSVLLADVRVVKTAAD